MTYASGKRHLMADNAYPSGKTKHHKMVLPSYVPVLSSGYKAGPVNATLYGLRPYIGGNDNAAVDKS